MQYAADLDLARAAARSGEAPFRAYLARAGGLGAESKEFRRELVTAADRAVEEAVVGCLRRERPDDAVLAEEGALTPRGRADKDADRVWIVDPIDGTTNYVHGLPYCCIAIALAVRGEPVVGVVHAPLLGRTWWATRGGGAFRDGAPIRTSATRDLGDALLATGFSYNRNEAGRDDNSARLFRVLPLCRDIRRYGSAEMDLCMVSDGTFDAYWEMYLAPYDVAAGGLIVAEAGGRVTDLEGGDRWLYGGQILATNGPLHDALLGLVGGPVPGGRG